jgi:hypothetical protein
MELVGAIYSIGITEHRGRFFERNLVLPIVGQGFAHIPLKHATVYTLMNSTAATNPLGATNHQGTIQLFATAQISFQILEH